MMSDVIMMSDNDPNANTDLLTHRPLVRCAVSDQPDVPTHIMPHIVPEDDHNDDGERYE